MNTVDLGFWVTFAAGFVTGICYGRREALVDRLLAMMDRPPPPRPLPRSHPAVRVLRDPYDYERDA